MAEARFTFHASRTTRKDAIAAVRGLAFLCGVVMHVEEERGFLESRFRVRMEGEPRVLDEVKQEVARWAKTWRP